MLNSWLHLVALITYLGAVACLWAMLLPSLDVVDRHEDKARLLARGLKLYNPLQIGALGVILFTGAFQLTEFKAAYRETFVQQLGYALGIKLFFAFFLVIVSVYQSMGIGHRLVKRHEAGETTTPQELDSIIRRLKSSNWCILALALVTSWLGLRLQS